MGEERKVTKEEKGRNELKRLIINGIMIEMSMKKLNRIRGFLRI